MDFDAVAVEIRLGEVPFALDIFETARTAAGARRSPPSYRRIVVVCAGVGYDLPRIIMRANRAALFIGAECELQNRHSGEAELFPQIFDLSRNDAQVFGDNGQH